MPFLEILAEKYASSSRDYTRELMAHRHFEYVLAEAYECKILSNPWLAASMAAKPVNPAGPTEGSTSAASSVPQQPPLPPVTSPPKPGDRGTPVESSTTPKAPNSSSDAAMRDDGDDENGNRSESMQGPSSPLARGGMNEAVISKCSLEGAAKVAAQEIDDLKSDSTTLEKTISTPPPPPLQASALQSPSTTLHPAETTEPGETASPSNSSTATSPPPPPPPHTSDPTFGPERRKQLFEAAKVMRFHHGITDIKEPGEDATLDFLINEVMLNFQRLKVRLLKASNREAQFRLDLETCVSQGLWNQYDISENTDAMRNQHADFVLYKAGSPSHAASRSSMQGGHHDRPRHYGGGAGSSGGYGSTHHGHHDEDQSIESYYIERSMDGGGWRAGSGAKMPSSGGGADSKRTASGKFEKDQVLPLTEWLLKHSSNPYPSMDDKADLARKSGLSTQQVQNWFINMRKRHWTPMMNGKRRPRTFLDYVILSSQQRGAEGGGGMPRGASMMPSMPAMPPSPPRRASRQPPVRSGRSMKSARYDDDDDDEYVSMKQTPSPSRGRYQTRTSNSRGRGPRIDVNDMGFGDDEW